MTCGQFVNLPRDPESGAFFCHLAAGEFMRAARRLLNVVRPDPFAQAWAELDRPGRLLLLRAARLPDRLERASYASLSAFEREGVREAAHRLHAWSGRLAGVA